MADTVKSRLHELDSADPGKPITLVLTSKGGGVPAGLDIIDTMARQTPVNTLCERWSTSMGAVITAAGAHRSSQPHAIFRFHEVQLDDDQQLRMLEQDHLLDILAEHSGKPSAMGLSERFFGSATPEIERQVAAAEQALAAAKRDLNAKKVVFSAEKRELMTTYKTAVAEIRETTKADAGAAGISGKNSKATGSAWGSVGPPG